MHYRIILSLVCLLVSANLANAAPFAYITNSSSNTVSVIDIAEQAIIGAQIPVGEYPYGVAINYKGDRVYVTNQVSKNISVLDATTNTVLKTIPFSKSGTSYRPGGLAINPAGTLLYVANQETGTVEVVDLATDTLTVTIPAGTYPEGVAINADGSRLYVANAGSDNLSVINTSTNAKVTDIPVGSHPYGVAVNPVAANNRVYVANNFSDTVSVIDTTTNTVAQTVNLPANSGPISLAVTIDGKTLYTANATSDTDPISVIDTATGTVTKSIPLTGAPGAMAWGIAATPLQYGTVLVTNSRLGSVSLIDSYVNTYLDKIEVGNTPQGLGTFIGPDLNEITAFSGPNGTVTPAGRSFVLKGQNLTYTIAPESTDYRIQEIRIGNNVLLDPATGQPYRKYPGTYTFTNVTNSNTIAAVFTQNEYSLSVAKYVTNTGTGTIASTPAGLTCDATCAAADKIYDGKSPVTIVLTATPSADSTFTGWDSGYLGPCSGTSPTCSVLVDRLHPVIYAKFTKMLNDKVKNVTTGVYYSTLQGAFDALSGTVELRVTSDTFTEPALTLNKVGAIVKLRGAFPTDKQFIEGTQVPTSPTLHVGMLTIANGTLIPEYLTIK